MNIASIIGLISGIVLMIFGIVFDMGTMSVSFGKIMNFIDIPSILITFGGSFTTLMTMEPSLKTYVEKLASFKLVLQTPAYNDVETIKNIIALSNVARKEGLLALEETANSIEDEFLKKGILLIVDGTDPELVRSILETELSCIEGRHSDTIGFWDKLSAMGPAWGMIGTLIGLVNMLKDLNDPSTIGPNMAVALVTTFYGSVLANWICIPVVNKLKARNAAEIMMKEVIVEGLLSIQAGENPRVIEEKLKSFLNPTNRAEFDVNEGGEVDG
ncbi:motility protein A [Anaerocolumna cellulosilytica]|uniref:Motility protein A n=1 Tax=Anaerocolumna cellulosilytica TaxID=433286 RepID=A0A6S6R1M6_9FIRM|nr:motility protein A [Anaerocolumna cellulosilytica]MBB5197025.1 chemotaxis protein MotA [Anaerocolumna cellulosilytica]BCJ95239.1 motility protein A [Anaerocolumna cellulosilytica]